MDWLSMFFKMRRALDLSYETTRVVDLSRSRFIARMPDDTFELVTVASGAQSLRSRNHGETFHPVIGPMAEARILHVAQQRLIERAAATPGRFVVWDIGLGAAANAIAVLEAFQYAGNSAAVELHSFDLTLAPLRFAVEHAEALEYIAPHRQTIEALLAHSETTRGCVRWLLHTGDIRNARIDAPAPHAVIYDPYSPLENPDLWTLEHFTSLFAQLDPPCLLSNYTRSTAVRVTLLLAGFFVGRGGATGEKNETTLAANDRSLLTAPLDHHWLKRVHRSTKGAPLRAGRAGSPIAADDWERLIAHPQFANP